MDRLTDAYYALLRAGLWADACWLREMPALDRQGWSAVMRIAASTGTIGIVADGVELLPAERRPSGAIMQQLLKVKVRLINHHAKANAALRESFAMITGMGFDPVLLKGQGLARYYAVPESRACGDIDIYVGAEHIDALVAKLTEAGVTCEEELNDTEKHIIFYYDDIVYELHRVSAELPGRRTDRAYQQWWRQGLERPQYIYITPDGAIADECGPDCQSVKVQRMEQNVLFTFYHVFHHFLGRYLTFKQYCDVARMLHACRGSIDAELLLAKIDECGLSTPWRVVGCYMHKYLGLPTEDVPGYDARYMHRADKMARRISRDIFFAKRAEDRQEGRVMGKLRSYGRSLRSASQSMGIFPRHTLAALWQDTTLGVRLLFSRANRQGTQQHYRERTGG